MLYISLNFHNFILLFSCSLVLSFLIIWTLFLFSCSPLLDYLNTVDVTSRPLFRTGHLHCLCCNWLHGGTNIDMPVFVTLMKYYLNLYWYACICNTDYILFVMPQSRFFKSFVFQYFYLTQLCWQIQKNVWGNLIGDIKEICGIDELQNSDQTKCKKLSEEE